MDDWKKFSETLLPETDAYYEHAKRVCKDFKLKNLRDYYDLFVQSNIFLLDDVLENFWNM